MNPQPNTPPLTFADVLKRDRGTCSIGGKPPVGRDAVDFHRGHLDTTDHLLTSGAGPSLDSVVDGLMADMLAADAADYATNTLPPGSLRARMVAAGLLESERAKRKDGAR